MPKLSALTSLATPDTADFILVLDVSDVTMGVTGTNKKATLGNLKNSLGIPPDLSEEVADLATTVAGKANTVHTHSIGNVTGLQAALDGKSATGHTHAVSDTTGLQAALDAKAATSHTHTTSNVTGLDAALAGKAATSHVHAAADITTGVLSTARIGSGTPANGTYVDGGTGAWTALPGGGGGGSPPFSGGTANPLVKDATDATKMAAFDASTIDTTVTRTYILPNASGTLALVSNTLAPLSSPGIGGASTAERYGAGSSVTTSNCMAIGPSSTGGSLGSVSVGCGAYAVGSGTNSTNIGNSAGSVHNGCLMLGYLAQSDQAHQCKIGSATIGIDLFNVVAEGSTHVFAPLVKSSTSVARNTAKLAFTLPTSTDASFKGRATIAASDFNGDREAIRVESDGTAALLGFYGHAATPKASAPTTLADVITILQNLGLCS